MRKVTSFVILTCASAFAVCLGQAPSQTKPAALHSTSAAPQVTISKPSITFAAPRAAPAIPPARALASTQDQVTIHSSKPENQQEPWHVVLHGQDYYCRLETTGSHVEKTPVCLTKRQLQEQHVQTQQFFESFHRNGAAEQAVTKTTMSNGGGAVASP